jgi:hypothetical protein
VVERRLKPLVPETPGHVSEFLRLQVRIRAGKPQHPAAKLVALHLVSYYA